MRAMFCIFFIILSATTLVSGGDCCHVPCAGSPTFSASPYCCYGGDGSFVMGTCACNAQQWNCALGGSLAQSSSILSVPRSSITAVSVDNSTLFFAGGSHPGGAAYDRVDVYSTTSKAFVSTFSLSSHRYSVGSISIGNYVLFAGGIFTNGSYSSTVDMYNIQNQTWSFSNSLYLPTYGIVTARVGSVAVLASYSPFINLFDVSSLTWSIKSWPSYRTSSVALSFSSGLAMIAGGAVLGTASLLVDTFDGIKWNTTTLSQAQYGMVGASVKNVGVMGGGYNAAGITTANVFVAVYVPEANYLSWSTKRLSVARNNLAATALGNYVIFAGGNDANGNPSNVVDFFNVVSKTFLSTTSNLFRARYGLVGASINGVAIFTGGIVSGGASTATTDVVLLPASWYTSGWGDCDFCVQYRLVSCRDISGQEQDASTACFGPKPAETQETCCHSPYMWIASNWFCDCNKGGIYATRVVTCLSSEHFASPEDRCDPLQRPINLTTCAAVNAMCPSSSPSSTGSHLSFGFVHSPSSMLVACLFLVVFMLLLF